MKLSALCGTFAPVCLPAFGITGGIAGGIAGDEVADRMPGMKPSGPPPGERDLGKLEDDIANNDDGVNAELAATVDLLATDIALADTDGDPAFQANVARLLPNPTVLRRVANGQPAPVQAPSVPTGTTTTTTPPLLATDRTDP